MEYQTKGRALARPFATTLRTVNDDYKCPRKRLVLNEDKAGASRLRRQSLMKKRLDKELFYTEAHPRAQLESLQESR
jgi:hypothetical protein